MTQITQNAPAPAGRTGRALGGIALAALCVLAAAGLYVYESHEAHTPAPPPAATAPAATAIAPATTLKTADTAAPAAAAPQTSQTAAAAAPAPSVDVVRVDKSGALVMAGRAAPGQRLTILNGETTLGTVTANDDGQWVFLPDAPLPSGVHELSIAASPAQPGGSTGRSTVLLSLPGGAAAAGAAAGQDAGPMVVLSQGNAPPRLLEGPAGHSGPVGLDIVQYDDQGRIRFTGHAAAGRTVRLYVNNKAVGEAVADARGVWSLVPAQDLKPGLYKLRTDELAPSGKVMARSEVPFARANLAQSLAAGQAVVQPGDCLWTIARHNYGHGIAYTAIFVKNTDQIRDPDRIYPGQVFHMPSSDEAAHAPDVRTIKKMRQGETSQG